MPMEEKKEDEEEEERHICYLHISYSIRKLHIPLTSKELHTLSWDLYSS